VRTPARIYTKSSTDIKTSKPSQTETFSDLLQMLIAEWTATRYEMDGSGFEPWEGPEIFFYPCPSRPPQEPTQPPLQWAPNLLPGNIVTGAWRCQPFHLAPRLGTCGSIPLLPLCAFKACYRGGGAGIFTFTNVDKNMAGART
jgi:hypothetical protein